MSDAVIFIYGLVVFVIVSAACWLIVWGVLQDRRDRQRLEAEPSPEGATSSQAARTLDSGATVGTSQSNEGAR